MTIVRRTSLAVVIGMVTAHSVAAATKDARMGLDVLLPGPKGGQTARVVVHGGEEDILEGLLGPASGNAKVVDSTYGDAVIGIGDKRIRVAPGQKKTVEIAADLHNLQILTIGGLAVLARIVPGELISLQPGSCGPWRLYSARIDPWKAHPPAAHCKRARAACRPGFVEALGRKFEDPLCRGIAKKGDEVQRCFVPGRVRIVSSQQLHVVISNGIGEEESSWDARPGIASEYITVGDETCGFWSLVLDGKRFLLAIAPSEKWTVNVDPRGGVSGHLD